jgi:hypothetical protein
LLVTGRLRTPCYVRITVITTVEEVQSKIFGNSQMFTQEVDQLHTRNLRPLTVLQALEAGLIRRIPSGWVWSEAQYEKLSKG